MSDANSFSQLTLQRLPGWALMIIIAIAATALSSLIEIGGKHPLEAAVVAILLGMLLGNTLSLPARCKPGIKAFEKLLVIGIVLLGAGFDLAFFMSQGLSVFALILTTMTLGFVGTIFFARLFGLSQNLAILLGVGTTICGGTAIAISAPVIRAKDEETSYAVGTIALWGLLAILAYPFIAKSLGVTDDSFGVFAGTAIHSTAQVVGAGYIFSDQAGEIATAVKLVRNAFIAPMVLLLAFWVAKTSSSESLDSKRSVIASFPWFLFGYFIMGFLNVQGVLPAELSKEFVSWGKFIVVCGMAGLGLNTQLKTFRSVGVTPLIVGLLGAVIVAATSVGLIATLLQ